MNEKSNKCIRMFVFVVSFFLCKLIKELKLFLLQKTFIKIIVTNDNNIILFTNCWFDYTFENNDSD